MSLNAAELDAILKRYTDGSGKPADQLQLAGFVVLDKNGKKLYSNTGGKATFEADSPRFTEDSVCWVASMTKLVTSVCAMQLVEKGLIGLDNDVGKLVPELAGKDIILGFEDDGSPKTKKSTRPVTLRNLLTHSSGSTYEVSDKKIGKWFASQGRTVPKDYSIDGINFPLLFEPGQGWSYGHGNDWAGLVIAAVAGVSLEEYMQRNIFTPLGMTSSTMRIADHPDLDARRAAVGFRATPDDAPAGMPKDPAPRDTKIDYGGVALFTTQADYAKLLSTLLAGGEPLLKRETTEELLRPQLEDPKALRRYCDGPWHLAITPELGMGFPINHTLAGVINDKDVPGKRKKGTVMWSGLTNPRWWIDRETGIAAVVFAQMLPMGDGALRKLHDELERAVYSQLSVKASL